MEQKQLYLPQRDDKRLSIVINYLQRLGLSTETIQRLFKEGLIYSDSRGNAVFVNYAQSAAEIKGTAENSRFMPTYRIAPDRFWYLGRKGDTVYICASATDALALYEIKGENAIYASMAGATNYKIVERILQSGRNCILALNNDPTCDRCRGRFPENEKLQHIKPIGKTWVEDLQKKERNIDGKYRTDYVPV